MAKDLLNSLSEDNLACFPKMIALNKKASRLLWFNTVASMALPISTILITTGLPYDPTVLITSVVSAASVQYSRWRKSKLKEQFDKVKEEIEPQNRTLILKDINPTINKKVNNSIFLISKKDFDIRNPQKAFGLGSAALFSLVSPTAGVAMFFNTLQVQEWSDSYRLQSSTDMNSDSIRMHHTFFPPPPK